MFEVLVAQSMQGGKRVASRRSACATCDADRITVADAFVIVNDGQSACSSCTELAWRLVADDLDAADVASDLVSAHRVVGYVR